MELNAFDKSCLEILAKLPHFFSRHCFRSAVHHLEMAEKLWEVDSSMAVFRCITAEEEAGTGLIRYLREAGYENADKLSPKNHKHKQAIIPFYQILQQFIQENFHPKGLEMDLYTVNEEGEIKTKFRAAMTLNGQRILFLPDPPFNIVLQHEEKRFSFKPQIEAFLQKNNAKTVLDHIDELVKLRNKVLYASPNGYPAGMEVEPKFFPAYQNRVFAMLRTYLLMVQYKGRQPFVQDCLDAFLSMLGALEMDDLHPEY